MNCGNKEYDLVYILYYDNFINAESSETQNFNFKYPTKVFAGVYSILDSAITERDRIVETLIENSGKLSLESVNFLDSNKIQLIFKELDYSPEICIQPIVPDIPAYMEYEHTFKFERPELCHRSLF